MGGRAVHREFRRRQPVLEHPATPARQDRFSRLGQRRTQNVRRVLVMHQRAVQHHENGLLGSETRPWIEVRVPARTARLRQSFTGDLGVIGEFGLRVEISRRLV